MKNRPSRISRIVFVGVSYIAPLACMEKESTQDPPSTHISLEARQELANPFAQLTKNFSGRPQKNPLFSLSKELGQSLVAATLNNLCIRIDETFYKNFHALVRTRIDLMDAFLALSFDYCYTSQEMKEKRFEKSENFDQIVIEALYVFYLQEIKSNAALLFLETLGEYDDEAEINLHDGFNYVHEIASDCAKIATGLDDIATSVKNLSREISSRRDRLLRLCVATTSMQTRTIFGELARICLAAQKVFEENRVLRILLNKAVIKPTLDVTRLKAAYENSQKAVISLTSFSNDWHKCLQANRAYALETLSAGQQNIGNANVFDALDELEGICLHVDSIIAQTQICTERIDQIIMAIDDAPHHLEQIRDSFELYSSIDRIIADMVHSTCIARPTLFDLCMAHNLDSAAAITVIENLISNASLFGRIIDLCTAVDAGLCSLTKQELSAKGESELAIFGKNLSQLRTIDTQRKQFKETLEAESLITEKFSISEQDRKQLDRLGAKEDKLIKKLMCQKNAYTEKLYKLKEQLCQPWIASIEETQKKIMQYSKEQHEYLALIRLWLEKYSASCDSNTIEVIPAAARAVGIIPNEGMMSVLGRLISLHTKKDFPLYYYVMSPESNAHIHTLVREQLFDQLPPQPKKTRRKRKAAPKQMPPASSVKTNQETPESPRSKAEPVTLARAIQPKEDLPQTVTPAQPSSPRDTSKSPAQPLPPALQSVKIALQETPPITRVQPARTAQHKSFAEWRKQCEQADDHYWATTIVLLSTHDHVIMRQHRGVLSDEMCTIVLYKTTGDKSAAQVPLIASATLPKTSDTKGAAWDIFHAFSAEVERHKFLGIVLRDGDLCAQTLGLRLRPDQYAIAIRGKIILGSHSCAKAEELAGIPGFFIFLADQTNHCFHRFFHRLDKK